MKKNYLIYTIFFTLFIFLSNLHAQEDGEWVWAKAYSGYENPFYTPVLSNSIVKSAFDEAGNVYILGTFMTEAAIDGECIAPPTISGDTHPGQVIAKFDTAGNLVWKKVIKFREAQFPKGIQIRGNKLYALVDVWMTANGPNSYLYYLDTLVYYNDVRDIPLEECTPPFGLYKQMNAFITFDLDGNVLQQHFLQYDDRVPDPVSGSGISWRSPLASTNNLPFYVDRNENIYMLGRLEINI